VTTIDEIAQLVREQTGFPGPLTEETALQADVGVYGDDLWDLLKNYAARFGVNMAGFRWYFHSPEEGFNLGGLVFRPPNARVQEIPITLGLLVEVANCGYWAVAYPEHQLPCFRGDILINFCYVVMVVVALTVLSIRGCTH
jgi:hypothetical protein